MYLPKKSLIRVGEEIRRVWREKNLTQKALAEEAGISRHTVSRVEQGNERVALNTYIHLAEILGSLENLVVETPPDPDLAEAHRWTKLS